MVDLDVDREYDEPDGSVSPHLDGRVYPEKPKDKDPGNATVVGPPSAPTVEKKVKTRVEDSTSVHVLVVELEDHPSLEVPVDSHREVEAANQVRGPAVPLEVPEDKAEANLKVLHSKEVTSALA